MSSFMSIPLLIFFPLLMSLIIISPFTTNNEITLRRFAKGGFTLHFIYTILMLALFDSANPYLSNIHFFGLDWLQTLGIKFSFKLDGIGIILTTLTSISLKNSGSSKSTIIALASFILYV